MNYQLSSISYDFGQKRVSANLQANGPNNMIAFMNVNVGVFPPSDISAAALNDYLVKEVRKALEEASKFAVGQP
jgi:hypothetical protein